MNARLARTLVGFYPRPWRERYGAEFEALLEMGPGDVGTVVNVLRAGLCEHIVPTRGGTMTGSVATFGLMVRRPSAYVPLAMSVAALAVMWIGPTMFGDLHSADEGPTAHLWHLLMAGQAPAVAFFAIKWMPRSTRRTVQVLAVQVGGIVANLAVVFLLGVG